MLGGWLELLGRWLRSLGGWLQMLGQWLQTLERWLQMLGVWLQMLEGWLQMFEGWLRRKLRGFTALLYDVSFAPAFKELMHNLESHDANAHEPYHSDTLNNSK